MARQKRVKHDFDRRELLIAVVVAMGSLAMLGFYEPSGKVAAKEIACDGTPNGFCDYAYKNRCEAGCSDCDACLQHCTQTCAEQGKFVNYCRNNYYCSCTDRNPCVR